VGGHAFALGTRQIPQLQEVLQKTWCRHGLKGEERVSSQRRRRLSGMGASPQEVRDFKEDGGMKKWANLMRLDEPSNA
jgi:hypothetical protein